MVEISDKEYEEKQARLKELENGVAGRKLAEQELRDRINELEIYNKAAVGRELKIMNLEKEVNLLLKALGEEPKYKEV